MNACADSVASTCHVRVHRPVFWTGRRTTSARRLLVVARLRAVPTRCVPVPLVNAVLWDCGEACVCYPRASIVGRTSDRDLPGVARHVCTQEDRKPAASATPTHPTGRSGGADGSRGASSRDGGGDDAVSSDVCLCNVIRRVVRFEARCGGCAGGEADGLVTSLLVSVQERQEAVRLASAGSRSGRRSRPAAAAESRRAAIPYVYSSLT